MMPFDPNFCASTASSVANTTLHPQRPHKQHQNLTIPFGGLFIPLVDFRLSLDALPVRNLLQPNVYYESSAFA